jgi:7-cyano-7-deazaguanine synthase in queuosine biosynthesis
MIKECLWSGGLDSTYMIYKYLIEGHHVDAYYVQLDNNPTQSKRELNAIKKLKPLLSKYDFTYKGILSKFNLTANKTDSVCMQQSPVFLLSAYYLSGPVCIGYIMNDDSISYINDYQSIVTALNLIRFKPLTLEFPLTKLKKEDIIKMLPDNIQRYTVWCESDNPKIKSCGKCSSCKRYDLAKDKI